MEKQNKILENQAWARMESILDQEMPVQKRRRGFYFWLLGFAALIVFGLVGYIFVDTLKIEEESVIAQSLFAKNDNNSLDIEDKEIQVSKKVSAKVNSKKELSDSINRTSLNEKKESMGNNRNSPTHTSVTFGNNNENSSLHIEAETSAENSVDEIMTTMPPMSENIPLSIELETSKGRKNIKDKLKYIYVDHYNKSDTKKALSFLDEDNQSIEKEKNNHVLKIDPLTTIAYNDTVLERHPYSLVQLEDTFVDVATESKKWQFGAFTSFQYLNKDFIGYDVGLSTAYKRIKGFSLSFKVGYERLKNTNEPVLSDARVGVLFPDNTNTFELDDGDILSSTQNAGFNLSDVILSMNNLLVESTASIVLHSKASIATGLGFKRLLSVSLRPISGLNSNTALDPSASINTLDSSELLQSNSVNQNRLYIPFEIQYSPINQMQIGLGTQFFINSNFKDFEENPLSLYSRLSIAF